MAKVILEPVGSSLDASSPRFRENREYVDGLVAELEAKRRAVFAGWGAKYVERVHAKGKLTAWERVERLKEFFN